MSKTIRKLVSERYGKELFATNLISSKSCNGSVGAFVPQICRLELSCNNPRPGAGGDSLGMLTFLRRSLGEVAKAHPFAEVCVKNQSGKPFITAHYANGTVLQIDVSRRPAHDILKLVREVCALNGAHSFRKPIKGPLKDRFNHFADWNPMTAPSYNRFKP